jgi:hypothetical protein
LVNSMPGEVGDVAGSWVRCSGRLGVAAAGARRGEGAAVTAWPRLGEVASAASRARSASGSAGDADGGGWEGSEARAWLLLYRGAG